MGCESVDKFLFNATIKDFQAEALELFYFQYYKNEVFRKWCDLLNTDLESIDALTSIPFMPISFFKSHVVATTKFEPQVIFESSGTSQTVNSKHFVKELNIYKQSFNEAFELFYVNPSELCIIGLLPSYLERKGSSLTMMVDELVKQSKYAESGFYLYDFDKLQQTLQSLEERKIPTLLIGVTFALLDFAESYKIKLGNTIVMETGGMKGRREEMTRAEVHNILCAGFGVKKIHSEYGMTELLSQAYSKGDGHFICPPWMKVLVRDEEDPLNVKTFGRGVLNIIDMANVYSAAFIATDDVGTVYEDGSFEVHGRLDNSDIRGCSLMVI